VLRCTGAFWDRKNGLFAGDLDCVDSVASVRCRTQRTTTTWDVRRWATLPNARVADSDACKAGTCEHRATLPFAAGPSRLAHLEKGGPLPRKDTTTVIGRWPRWLIRRFLFTSTASAELIAELSGGSAADDWQQAASGKRSSRTREEQ